MAEAVIFAYILQAAVARARATLRIPQAGRAAALLASLPLDRQFDIMDTACSAP